MEFLNKINFSDFFATFYGPTGLWIWKLDPLLGEGFSEGVEKSTLVYTRDLAAKLTLRTLTIGLMIFGTYYGMEKSATTVLGQALKFDSVVNLIKKSPILSLRAALISTLVLGGIFSLIIEKNSK